MGWHPSHSVTSIQTHIVFIVCFHVISYSVFKISLEQSKRGLGAAVLDAAAAHRTGARHAMIRHLTTHTTRCGALRASSAAHLERTKQPSADTLPPVVRWTQGNLDRHCVCTTPTASAASAAAVLCGQHLLSPRPQLQRLDLCTPRLHNPCQCNRAGSMQAGDKIPCLCRERSRARQLTSGTQI